MVADPGLLQKICLCLRFRHIIYYNTDPYRAVNQVKILMPVGIAIIIVAAVKYARVSISVPIVNIWWTQTKNPMLQS